MINKYFANLEDQIRLFDYLIHLYNVSIKNYSSTKGYIIGEIIFTDKSKLSFREVKDIELQGKDKYAYNYIDGKNNLIFRYDNAPHYKQLDTFPHHKHLPDKIVESYEPELIDIIFEIADYLKNK